MFGFYMSEIELNIDFFRPFPVLAIFLFIDIIGTTVWAE